ncbi:hypothetical protein QLH52_02985 [Methylomonas sp. OY6]|uniref:Uncharacterized protein n=1 Tax=Methylomonas defluvii TaxID=3045149 RepID=A0ABU4U9Z4_9GAMM|nr:MULTISPECIES: hypothetical protein [unclassified Methylomonas]MDX8126230.1 hypothetical protein [Methylomonas sp. OY6]PKD41708.1 hypothetical protein CWO84_02990 [Methylomonas sp. Kb3]
MENFVILIGGPGLFMGCDKAHDQRWSNYIVPLQLAAMKNLYNKQPKELIHWVLYEPPYKKRWDADSVITKAEEKEDDGYNLHSIRKMATDKLIAAGGTSYINKIQTIAKTYSIQYKGINQPEDFWSYLLSLSDNSISRVWYSGHASGDGLMLALTHNSACQAAAFATDMIYKADILKNSALVKKFIKKPKQVSKFYGCYTEGFAKTWNGVFGVASAGAKNKIDFGVVDTPSNITNIMERIEKTPTSLGNPNWTEYK